MFMKSMAVMNNASLEKLISLNIWAIANLFMKASDYLKQSYLDEIGQIEYNAIRAGHLTDLIFAQSCFPHKI